MRGFLRNLTLDFHSRRRRIPCYICRELMYASMTKDEHCFKIKDICNKLLLVAESKRRMGEITSEQEKEIKLLVKYSDTYYEMFMPIIYVTEFSVIEQICEPADNEKKASVLSGEYLCREIPRDYFEIVSMKEIVGFFDLYNM